MSVTTETATVFRGGGRRWFTQKAALNAEAKALYRKATSKKDRCDCSTTYHDGFGDIPETCKYHDYELGIHARYKRFAIHQILKATQ